MSKFRVELDVAFNNENDAIAFLNLAESWKDKVAQATVNSSNPTLGIITRARYHECFHDEVPAKACGDYIDIDFSTPEKIEHVTKSGEVMMISADNTSAVTKESLTELMGKLEIV